MNETSPEKQVVRHCSGLYKPCSPTLVCHQGILSSFFEIFIFILYVCAFCQHVERVSSPLELNLETIVSSHVGARD